MADLATRVAPTFPLRFDTLASLAPPRSQTSAALSLSLDASEAPPTPGAPTRPSPSRAPSAATAAARDARPEVLLDALGPAVKASARRAKESGIGALLEAGERSVEEVTPWFGVVRDAVLGKRDVSAHETFGWPVGGEFASCAGGGMYAHAALSIQSYWQSRRPRLTQ